ncbi:MAG: DMT family transporter [Firmicutes bacterium]|nr:DMT family transporter [Bacillota bacterium]
MDKKNLGALMVALSALGFGLMAVFAKIAYSEGVNTLTMLSVRFTAACAIIWLVILFTGRRAAVSPGGLCSLAVLSLFGYGGGSTFFFMAVNLLPASLASLLLYTYPVLVSVAETALYRQRLTAKKLAALFLSTTGLVLVLGAALQGASPAGLLYGLAASVSYTVYLLYGNRLTRKSPPLLTTGYLLLFAAIGFSAYTFFTGSFCFAFGPAGWWSIAALAVFSTAFAILALFSGMRWIEAGRAAIISSCEPVFTVLCAALFLSERLRPVQIAGGLMVLAAIVLLQYSAPGRTEEPVRGNQSKQSEI